MYSILISFYIAEKRRSPSSNMFVPVILRKELEKNSKRLRFAISKAAKYRIAENTSFDEKIKNLKKDIINAPSHVFGEHLKCQEIKYFKCDKTDVNNLVPPMKECGLYRDVEICLNRIILNIDSLLYNMDNNTAEHYNSLVCKFVGGKRVNFSKRMSYKTRCEAAVVSYNSGPNYYRVMNNALKISTVSQFTEQYIKKKQQIKERYTKLSAERKSRRQEMRKKMEVSLPDKDYGATDSVPDMTEEQYVAAKSEFLIKLKKTKEQIANIEMNTRNQTSSLLWLEERQIRLTASNFGKICKLRPSTNSTSTIQNLIYSKFCGNDSTNYGKISEPFALEAFEKTYNVKVNNCGLFIDEINYFLGATPDGLVGDDAIIEIKCPASIKNISPLEGIITKKINFATIENEKLKLKRNHNYYFQVQGQLQITKRKICYFIVWSSQGCLIEKVHNKI